MTAHAPLIAGHASAPRWQFWRQHADKHHCDLLAQRVCAKASALSPPPNDAHPSREDFACWVRLRFEDPLHEDANWARRFSRAFTWLSLGTIAAGLGSSALASADAGAAALIAALGIVVGVLTAMNQILRPGQRSVAKAQAANALRREGWDFVLERGRYSPPADGKPEDRRGIFIAQVDRIQRAVELLDERMVTGDQAGQT